MLTLALAMFGCQERPTEPAKPPGTAVVQTDKDKADAVKPPASETKAPIPKEKWDLSYAEKAWGVTLKSVTYEDNRKPPLYKLVLEFTKDINSDERQAIYGALNSVPRMVRTVDFYFLDADNVVMTHHSQFTVEGEVTGKKGDAFRLYVLPAADQFKAVKVVLRPRK
jgi:hypothetical protein